MKYFDAFLTIGVAIFGIGFLVIVIRTLKRLMDFFV